jgi:MFS family permease
MMSFAFLIVFGVKHLDMSEATAGVMTSIILITQMVSGVVMGRLADKFNRKLVMALGLIATVLSSFVAWLAVDTSWMYPVFILMGFGNGIFWTIGVAMTMDFASGPELPLYIGTANTFTTPGAVLAPLLGGWLADSFGYQATFLASWICGLFALIFLISFVKIPMKRIS